MAKKVIIGEAIILVACFLLSAFYHWEINPDNWPVGHRGSIIAIYLGTAILGYPFALAMFADFKRIDNEPDITKEYVGKEFIHDEKGKVKVNFVGTAERDDEKAYYVTYSSLESGHLFEDFLDEFQKHTKVDDIKLLANE